jgi:hypothetical protein
VVHVSCGSGQYSHFINIHFLAHLYTMLCCHRVIFLLEAYVMCSIWLVWYTLVCPIFMQNAVYAWHISSQIIFHWPQHVYAFLGQLVYHLNVILGK